MIDPLISQAFSIHSNKGVYALLLGSGVSRAAQVPTGWEIVLDLVRKLAHLRGENCEPNPAAWYNDRFGKELNYSELLGEIAKSPTERSQLLKSYFEPTEEDRQQGTKLPTRAHNAIAELVASGHFRVILTTNFDRLIEKALEAVGVTPTIISTPDAVEGAIPLAHGRCYVIKLHGDYLDTRIKNSPVELESYDKRTEDLLDRILDEYGLIVCGWSAVWDTALRAALERCKSHRFTTYWATRSDLGELPRRLVALRRAEVVRIQDADSFFHELREKVRALEELDRPHPLSKRAAVAAAKMYLAEFKYRIQLHDLVTRETERVYTLSSDEHFPVERVQPTYEELHKRIERYEAIAEILQEFMIVGCYWGEQSHEGLWVASLERIAGQVSERGGNTALLNLRYYPALLLLYSAGIASIAARKYGAFASLMRAKIRPGGIDQPLIAKVLTGKVIEGGNVAQKTLGMPGSHTPLSDRLYDVLHEPLREFLLQEEEYQRTFDRFEYLLALVYADWRLKQEGMWFWAPVGCFLWRNRYNPEATIMSEVGSEAEALGEKWPPLKAGLFDGSPERFASAAKKFHEFIAQFPIF